MRYEYRLISINKSTAEVDYGAWVSEERYDNLIFVKLFAEHYCSSFNFDVDLREVE